jgi:hypothetical protein
MPQTQIVQLRTVPVDIARIAKARAAMKGVTMENYLTQLITKAMLAKENKK